MSSDNGRIAYDESAEFAWDAKSVALVCEQNARPLRRDAWYRQIVGIEEMNAMERHWMILPVIELWLLYGLPLIQRHSTANAT